VLLIADPGVPARLAAESLPDAVTDRRSSPAWWETSVRIEPFLRHEQASLPEVIDSVEPSKEDADVVIYMTDLPRRDDTLPVIAEISVQHRFGLISVAGVGATFVARRLLDLVVLAIAVVTNQPELRPRSAARLPSTDIREGVRYFAPCGPRRLRLLAGMVRANRPWRFVAGLSKVLVGALGTGALGLATDTIWLFADTIEPWRMCATTVLSIGAMVTWLVLDHELWERPKSSAERARSRLYNVATLITVIIGVAVLYVALLMSMLFAASITISPDTYARILGHPVVADYLSLAWLVASIATVGGALGSGLEDDDRVRAAAYGIRQRQRFDE
jgi:uncharacterized membrane protein